jgi:dTDP-4-amino-4,6-dideoxygalactose transaminase
LNGIVDKYTWVDDGSSWAMSDISAAFLYGQLEKFKEINDKRKQFWNEYKDGLTKWAETFGVAMPKYSTDVEHVGHIFFLRFKSKSTRDNFIKYMKKNGIQTPFHYQALHQAPYAKRFNPNDCPNSNLASDTLVRLPLYYSLESNELNYIITKVNEFKEFN